MKKLFTLLTLLVMGLGSMWAETLELTPTGGVTTIEGSSTTSTYDATATSWIINYGVISGGALSSSSLTDGPYCLVKFDASSIPAAATITKATISFDTYCTVSGKNSGLQVAKMTDASWDATSVIWSTEGFSKAASQIATGTWSASGTTSKNISYDITSNVDKALIGFAIYTSTGREHNISNIKLTIEYTTATVYTATFTETTGVVPTVTIYSDDARTTKVDNGTLQDATTYYYTATAVGYVDYKGSFTVAAANPEVSFTMTAKKAYTINAVCGSTVLKEGIASGYAEASTEYTVTGLPYMISTNGTCYVLNDDDVSNYSKTFTMGTTDETKTVSYTESDVDYFFEAESLGAKSYGNATGNYSDGTAAGVYSGASMTTSYVAAGIYTVTVNSTVRRANADSLTVLVSTDGTNYTSVGKIDLTSSVGGDYSATGISLPAGGYIRLTESKNQNMCHYIDYVTLKNTATLVYSTGVDKTSLITNPSFESTVSTEGVPEGWTVAGDPQTSATADADIYGAASTANVTAGSQSYYTGWNGRNISQVLSQLPKGHYKLTADASSWGASPVIYAGSNFGTISALNAVTTLSVEFDVTNGPADVTIGITGTDNATSPYATGGTWGYFVDNFTLTLLYDTYANMACASGKLGTFCAPFDVTLPENVKAYSATSSSNEVSLTKLGEGTTYTLTAGTPAIIYNDGSADVSTLFYGVASVTENKTVGALTGLIANATVPASSYVLNTVEGVQQFCKISSEATGILNRCYVTANKSAGAKALAISFDDDDVTGIQTVDANVNANNAVRYNLAGQRVSANTKGIVIMNGKKYLNK